MTPRETAAADPPRRPAASPRIIVSEPSGRWAVALRRELAGEAAIEETRSVAECWRRLADSPESLVVVEVTTGNLDALLKQMARREREFPRSRVAVVADRRLAGCEWLLREAGAAAFVTSPRRAATLAALARRHIENQPKRPDSPTDQIWASLPWSEHATRPESAVES